MLSAKNAIEVAIRRGWLKEFMDMSSGYKEEKLWRKKEHDEEELKDRKPIVEAKKTQTRADIDKNCRGVIHTIVRRPPALS